LPHPERPVESDRYKRIHVGWTAPYGDPPSPKNNRCRLISTRAKNAGPPTATRF
jgi:hypothetical protein